MKAPIVGILALLAATSATAQERTPLPGIVVGAPPPAAPDGPPPLVLQPPAPQAPAPLTIGPSQDAVAGGGTGNGGGQKRCADGSGKDRSLGCLNDKLKKEVDKVNPTANIPPLDAKSADPKIGVVNIPGVRQQYGPNFGVSAFPYRPGAPVYAPPVGHR